MRSNAGGQKERRLELTHAGCIVGAERTEKLGFCITQAHHVRAAVPKQA